jgi:hypothetical protein
MGHPSTDFARVLPRRSGLNDHFDLGSIFINFCAYRGGTISAEILIFFPFGQDQKQPFSNGHCPFTLGTIKGGCFELFETGFLHAIIIKKDERVNNHFFSSFWPILEDTG